MAVILPFVLVACSAPTRAIRIGLDSMVPTLAGPMGPMPDPGGGRSAGQGSTKTAETGKAVKYPDTIGTSPADGGSAGTVDRLPASMVQPPPSESFVDAPKVSMVPASGDQRSRLVRSARRLVGIRNSFDSRSFIGHLLAICDLLPGTQSSVGWTSVDQMNLARDAGAFRRPADRAVAGDIVYFTCRSGCGADSREGVGVGVVVELAADRVLIIAYRDGVVGQLDTEKEIDVIGYSAP